MTAVKKERRVLAGAAVAVLLLAVYCLWPRRFQPPLVGVAMGEPVRDSWVGVCRRVTYTFPGDYQRFSQNAAVQLSFLRYKAEGNYFQFYRHPDGSTVTIYPGKWKPWQTEDGLIDTRIAGWITISFDSPPDGWRQTWFAFFRRFHTKTAKMSAARKASP